MDRLQQNEFYGLVIPLYKITKHLKQKIKIFEKDTCSIFECVEEFESSMVWCLEEINCNEQLIKMKHQLLKFIFIYAFGRKALGGDDCIKCSLGTTYTV